MPLMRIQFYYIYATEDEKLVQELGRFTQALARFLYPHLTEDSEIFFSRF